MLRDSKIIQRPNIVAVETDDDPLDEDIAPCSIISVSHRRSSSSSSASSIMKVRTLDLSLKSISHTNGTFESRKKKQSFVTEDDAVSANHPDSETVSVVTGPSSECSVAVHDRSDRLRSRSTSISFDQCVVREYDICVGDNPCVRTGAPLSLGWKYLKRGTISVDDYEQVRPSEERRVSGALLIPRMQREQMMMEFGYGRRDMRDAVREVQNTKYHRLKTVNTLGWSRFEECMESLKRKIKRILKPKQTKLERMREREVMEHSQRWSEQYRNSEIYLGENEDRQRAAAEVFIREENEAAAAELAFVEE